MGRKTLKTNEDGGHPEVVAVVCSAWGPYGVVVTPSPGFWTQPSEPPPEPSEPPSEPSLSVGASAQVWMPFSGS